MIEILKPGDEAALEAFLLPRIQSSMFLLGNMRASGLIDTGHSFTGTYAAAVDREKVIGVVAHYWNMNLVIQAPDHVGELCRAAATASGRPVRGLLGPNAHVVAANEALGITATMAQKDEAEKLYGLELRDLAVPAALTTGAVNTRRIESKDVDLIIKWRVGFAIESLGEKDGPELRAQVRESIERALKAGRMWILEAGGVPVACSSFNTIMKEAAQVGGVWTPPELRGRGYARAVVAASLLDARAAGVGTAILFTGESNIAAQKAYVALGFRHVGDYRLTLLRSPLTVAEEERDATGL